MHGMSGQRVVILNPMTFTATDIWKSLKRYLLNLVLTPRRSSSRQGIQGTPWEILRLIRKVLTTQGNILKSDCFGRSSFLRVFASLLGVLNRIFNESCGSLLEVWILLFPVWSVFWKLEIRKFWSKYIIAKKPALANGLWGLFAKWLRFLYKNEYAKNSKKFSSFEIFQSRSEEFYVLFIYSLGETFMCFLKILEKYMGSVYPQRYATSLTEV